MMQCSLPDCTKERKDIVGLCAPKLKKRIKKDLPMLKSFADYAGF